MGENNIQHQHTAKEQDDEGSIFHTALPLLHREPLFQPSQ